MRTTMLSDDHGYIKALENWCILGRCQPSEAWATAYDEGHFTMASFMESESMRLGIDLLDSEAVQKRVSKNRDT
jgi:hypothetical protein